MYQLSQIDRTLCTFVSPSDPPIVASHDGKCGSNGSRPEMRRCDCTTIRLRHSMSAPKRAVPAVPAAPEVSPPSFVPPSVPPLKTPGPLKTPPGNLKPPGDLKPPGPLNPPAPSKALSNSPTTPLKAQPQLHLDTAPVSSTPGPNVDRSASPYTIDPPTHNQAVRGEHRTAAYKLWTSFMSKFERGNTGSWIPSSSVSSPWMGRRGLAVLAVGAIGGYYMCMCDTCVACGDVATR